MVNETPLVTQNVFLTTHRAPVGGEKGPKRVQKGSGDQLTTARWVQGGCEEGARRVQGGCEEGARRGGVVGDAPRATPYQEKYRLTIYIGHRHRNENM